MVKWQNLGNELTVIPVSKNHVKFLYAEALQNGREEINFDELGDYWMIGFRTGDLILIHGEKYVDIKTVVFVIGHEYLHGIIESMEDKSTSRALDNIESFMYPLVR